MQVRTRSLVMWGIAAALATTGGCRSTSQDRIRVLEAERSDLARENDHLKSEIADERGTRLAAESRAEATDSQMRALAASVAARGGGLGLTSVDTADLSKRLTGTGLEVRPGADGSAAIVFASDITFGSGRADLNPKVMATLKRVATEVKSTAGVHAIRVEGHTDSDPIKKSGWASNEELSRARAEVVRKFLVSQGIEENLLSVDGLGPTRPIVTPEKTAADKAKNRRVEVVLMPLGK